MLNTFKIWHKRRCCIDPNMLQVWASEGSFRKEISEFYNPFKAPQISLYTQKWTKVWKLKSRPRIGNQLVLEFKLSEYTAQIKATSLVHNWIFSFLSLGFIFVPRLRELFPLCLWRKIQSFWIMVRVAEENDEPWWPSVWYMLKS